MGSQDQRPVGVALRRMSLWQSAVGTVASLFAAMLFPPSSLAQDAVARSPIISSTIDVPDYAFEHEETQPARWRINGPHPWTDSFTYLILEPNEEGVQRRAIVLVDSIENPKRAFFLAGPKLQAVPEVKGKPLRERIDKPLSDRARLLDTSGTATINVVPKPGQKEQIKFSFAPALSGFYEKFDDIPCLTLPAVLTLSRGGRTLELVALLKNGKSNVDFDSRCGKFTDNLVPPAFSYIVAARLRFAFGKKRFVIHHANYVISIPYDVDGKAIGRSGFLVTNAQLKKILTDFDNFPHDPDTRPEMVERQTRNETFAVQHAIDAALIAVLKANRTNP